MLNERLDPPRALAVVVTFVLLVVIFLGCREERAGGKGVTSEAREKYVI